MSPPCPRRWRERQIKAVRAALAAALTIKAVICPLSFVLSKRTTRRLKPEGTQKLSFVLCKGPFVNRPR